MRLVVHAVGFISGIGTIVLFYDILTYRAWARRVEWSEPK
jgi:hypothetical protein